MLKIRPIRPEHLTLLGSAFLLLAYNLPLWRHLLEVTPAGWRGVGLVLAFAALLFAGFNLILTPLAVRGVLKPVLSVLLLVSAGVAYFMNHYGVLIDVEMLRNVAETDPAEVRDLLSFKLGAYLLHLSTSAWRAAGMAALARAGSLAELAARVARQRLHGPGIGGADRSGSAVQLPGTVVAAAQPSRAAHAGGAEQLCGRGIRPAEGQGAGRAAAIAAGRRRRRARRQLAGAPAQVADGAGGGRKRAGGELLPEWLWPRHQPTPAGGTGADQLQRRAFLRHGNRGIGALHVLRPDPCALQRWQGKAPGRAARCTETRRLRGALARQPVGL
ncbi:Phosphoethanolamine transferase EptA [compost metagenome]